jgi:4-amino-4-deoxy-L-arabinose transferase-like glycosyltransferase
MKLEPRHRPWLYLAALVGTAQPLVTFDIYALFLEETAHTGLPTRWLAWGMLGVAGVAFLALLLELRGPSRACRALAAGVLVLGLLGAANVWAFEHYNVLMDYEVWVKQKKMPAKYAPPGMGFQLPRMEPPQDLPDAEPLAPEEARPPTEQAP